MSETAAFLVVGGGIAGASAAAFLAPHGPTVLLERESQPGYHTTGRSAATYTETYGNRVVRGLTAASGRFLAEPPDGFADGPILTPRGVLLIARPDQTDRVDATIDDVRAITPDIARLDGDETRRLAPLLRPGYAAAALHEPRASAIDVHALHHGFLRMLRRAGGRVVTDAEVTALHRDGETWTASTRAGTFCAPVVVNAAGAWADVVAGLAGARPLGLVPKRRTILTFDAPAGLPTRDLPAVIDIDERFYVMPEAGGRLLGSPADETPSPPCDAQPDELDVATAVDRIERAVDFPIRRIHSRWAGLRTFAPDKTLVAGWAADRPGFLWCAGQGGYGIQTAPAMGWAVAALATVGAWPTALAERGVTAADLAADRPSLASADPQP